jgi:hypothetical protein
MKFAWKHRRLLWKYRNLIRHRKEIAAIAAAGLVVTVAYIGASTTRR